MAENKTAELWQEFRPKVGQIPGRIGTDLFSLQNFPAGYFRNFNPQTQFEKWAAVEVNRHTQVPSGMETLTVPAGLFAVFHYKGSSADGPKVFRYIYSEWLPRSAYILDDRPHFEILGAKYVNDDPNSEEDIWIPVRPKT